MARKTPTYRPVSITIWDDIRFHSLSEEGKLLWLFFLTSSECPIPGVLIAGETAVAERLSWPVARVRNTFAELVARRINVLWEGRVLWCVNGLKHQPVCNPNQLKSLATAFRNVPDVSFKHALWQALREACKGWSAMFGEFFAEPDRVDAAATSPTDQISLPILSSTNRCLQNPGVQEQQQEQDLEQEFLISSSSGPPTTGGGDLEPARPAPATNMRELQAKYSSRIDAEALEDFLKLKAGGFRSFPEKGKGIDQ